MNTGEVYSKKAEIIEEKKEKINNDDLLKNITLLDLYNIYNNLLEIYNNKQNKANVIQRKIYVDKYKIEDKLEYIRKRIQDENINDFSELIKESECKMETVVTFLALLEMIKQRMIKVYQSDNFGRIIIERREEHAEKESNTNSIYG